MEEENTEAENTEVGNTEEDTEEEKNSSIGREITDILRSVKKNLDLLNEVLVTVKSSIPDLIARIQDEVNQKGTVKIAELRLSFRKCSSGLSKMFQAYRNFFNQVEDMCKHCRLDDFSLFRMKLFALFGCYGYALSYIRSVQYYLGKVRELYDAFMMIFNETISLCGQETVTSLRNRKQASVKKFISAGTAVLSIGGGVLTGGVGFVIGLAVGGASVYTAYNYNSTESKFKAIGGEFDSAHAKASQLETKLTALNENLSSISMKLDVLERHIEEGASYSFVSHGIGSLLCGFKEISETSLSSHQWINTNIADFND